MTVETIATTPIPAAIDRAWHLLAATVGDDVFSDIAITQAADALVDVFPPYPPAPTVPKNLPQQQGIEAAIAALTEPATAHTSIADRLRMAAVVHALRRIDRCG